MGDHRANGAVRFKDQVALVVGGAQGIGKAIATRLGREGAIVVIGDIDRPMMDATVREMCAEQSQARQVYCDVREETQVTAMVEQVMEWYGRIDVLMYIAGIAPKVPFVNLPTAVWDDTIDINLRGGFLVSRAVVPHMVARRSGTLVFMASTNSWDAEATLAQYNASKAGLYMLAKTIARECGHYGIRSNAVGPGFIRTRLTQPVLNDPEFMKKYDPARGLIPLGRLGTPEDVAGPALFLASEDAAFVNGVLLFVDGGQLA
ncbi:MAG TPA: SDR family oxidoreductase [Bryobacteraceae bacterium]|nr:SDR family oxidoreductase [Bryobacteraceae bacterium]